MMTIAMLGVALPASAQSPGGRIEVSGGIVWMGGASLGTRPATETAPGGGRFQLFSTDSSLEGAAGLSARVGASLSRTFQIDVDAAYVRPSLATVVSGDAEQAAGLTASERLQQITIGGELLAHLWKWPLGSRGVPFVAAGAGYLRQLHESQTLAVNGRTYNVGGGVKFRLNRMEGRRLKTFGVRLDVRAEARQRGVAFDDRLHVSPVLAASLFGRF